MSLVFPKPKPNQERYHILEEGFRKYPKRFDNYKKYQCAKKNEKINYMPIKLDVENVSRCNLRCDMCQVSSFPNNKRAGDMTLDDFKKIVDEQIGLTEIKIQGMGEPFLGKDFIQMVEYANSLYLWTRSSTNATILHVNDNYKRIIDAGIGELQISVDGVTKETFERIRRNAKFEKIVENCKSINKYCEKLDINKTSMWVLLQKENLHEFHKFPTFAKELGFKRIAIIMDVNGWGNVAWTATNNEKRVSYLITQSEISDLLDKANKHEIVLGFWDINGKFTPQNLCPWPFERAYISSDMKVVPCCMIANPDNFNLGELGTFKEIWNGSKYKHFRQLHLAGKIPTECKSCYQ